MGNNRAGLLILDKETRQMLDSRFVEVVRRLVEEEQIRLLDKRRSEKEPRLLSS